MKDSALVTLYKARQTIFTTKDLSLLWKIENAAYLKTKLHRLLKHGRLRAIRRGFYALSEEYDPMELAGRMVIPSYVSLQTILAQAGALFQYDHAITSIAGCSRNCKVDGREFIYRKMKYTILFAREGVTTNGTAWRATPERAWMDWLCLSKEAFIDNPRALDWNQCRSLLLIYNNRALEQRFNAWDIHSAHHAR